MNMMKRMPDADPGDAPEEKSDGIGSALKRFVRLFGVDGNQAPDEPYISNAEPVVEAEPTPNLRPKPSTNGHDISTSVMLAFDALNSPVLLVGERLIVLYANKEARYVFSDNIQGHRLSQLLREPRTIDEIEMTFADGQARHINVNINAPLKRQYRLCATRLTNGPEEPVRVVLEFQETTLIRRSESMRSEFVSNVSHELRSPLATLIGFIETLMDGGEDALVRARFLGIMDGEAQRMSRLIDDLLSLTNVELYEHDRIRTRVNIAEVLQEVSNALAPRARGSDLSLRIQCPANLPDVVGDRDQVIQVFQNLVTNAIKYGAEGKCVDIIAEVHENRLPDSGDSVEVRVCDYGPGIEAEHLPRLTERFYRVDKGRSRAVGGTGLGLAIVKHIVSRHRGRLQVESELGKGSVFKVRLPAYLDGETES